MLYNVCMQEVTELPAHTVLYPLQKMFSYDQNPEYTAEKNLARQVATRNAVNVMANELRLHFREVLSRHVGKKVLKVTPYRTWTAKVKEELLHIEEWMEEQNFRMRYELSCSSIWVEIDKTYPVGEHTVNYVKQIITIGKVEDCVLVSCDIKCEPYRTNYTVEEVKETRKKIAELDREISALKSSIHEFKYQG